MTTKAAPQARILPATGQALPPLGLGGAALGGLYAPVSDADAAATLAAAWAAGLTYFDTAPYYGHGLSEQRLGNFLRGGGADGALVSSKVGRTLVGPGEAEPYDTGFVGAPDLVPVFDYSRDAVMAQVETSLARLGRDRLDVCFVHDIGAMTHGDRHADTFRAALEGALPALAELKAAGVVGAIGIGVNETAVCLEMLAHADLDAILIAGRYTLLDQSAEDELLPLCQARGVGVIVGGPFNSGLLAGGTTYDYAEAPATLLARRDRLTTVCAAHATTLTAAALAFPLRHPAVVSVIAGARSPAEVAANAAALAAPPPAGLWDDLAAEGLIR
jgi:D-threo-aldose 1-dehydrogenase